MKRLLAALLVLVAAAATLHAHFIWIVPERLHGPQAKVVFSENLSPDDPALLAKIEKLRLWVRDEKGEESRLDWKKGDKGFALEVLGEGLRTVGGTCDYGVVDRSSPAFRLYYYPKMILGDTDKGDTSKKWDMLPLELVPKIVKSQVQVQALFKGKPVANAEFFVLPPGGGQGQTFKTKADGLLKLNFESVGNYGFRVKHVEETPGKLDGKDYKEVRHWATLVMDLGSGRQGAGVDREQPEVFALAAEDKAENPEASKLLADARAARAAWDNFPGFSADLVANMDGKTAKGKLHVDAKGKVQLEGLPAEFELWAKRSFGSIVAHRMGGGPERNTPCIFVDNVADHPMGRLIQVLNDELHSGYRIRGKEIVEVLRTTRDERFKITVLENRVNKEGKYLPASYVVEYWSASKNELLRAEKHHQTWVRVGAYDLPATALVSTTRVNHLQMSGPEQRLVDFTANSLTLSNHKLLEAAPGK